MTYSMHIERLHTLTLGLIASAALAACGGGDGESATTDTQSADVGTATAQATQVGEVMSAKVSAGAATPATWTKVASEGASFQTTGVQLVRFGAGTSWAQKIVSGTAQCTSTYFGKSPATGQTRECDVFSASSASGTPSTGIYVDSVAGSDSNPGTMALPLKTLAKLSTTQIPAGQSVNLKCGSTWRESAMLDGHTFGNGTVFAGYGTCTATSKAVISGADNYSTGWAKSGNVWSKHLPTGTAAISFLYVNGTPVRVAQWPNYGGIGHEYSLTSSTMAPSSTTLAVASADLAAIKGQDLTGATIQVRTEPWMTEAHSVASMDANGNIVLSTPTSYVMEPAEGYVLQNKLWMLDAPGEFFQDKSTGILYVWPADSASQQNLNASLVEGSVRPTNLQLRNKSNLVVRNISFVKATQDGLLLADTPNALVDSVTADDNVNNGIRMASSSSTVPSPAGTVVQNSSFQRNVLAGVDSSTISNVSLLNNSVSDTGMSPNAGTSNAGLTIGASNIARGNVVSRSAQVGIGYSGTGGTQVIGNLVVDSGQRFSDGGAIKTRNNNNATTNQSSLVDSNTIIRAPGNSEGSVGGANNWAAGVYLDDYTLGATVSNNFIVAAAVGISVHNTSHSVISSNRVALASMAPLFANMDQTNADYMIGNTFNLNQWMTAGTSTGTYPALPQQSSPPAVMFWHSLLGSAAIGPTDNNFTGNKFQLPTGTSSPVASIRGTTTTSSLSMQDWLNLSPGDSLDTAVPQYSTSLLNTGPNLIQGGTFDNGLGAWTSYTQAVSPRGIISAYALPGCVGTCAVLQSGSVNDNVSAPAFNMVPGALYYLSYTASFANNGSISRPNVRQTASPYNTYSASRVSTSSLTGTAGATISQQTYFIATSSDPATVALSAAAGTVVGFDQVTLQQVLNYSFAAPSDWVSYGYANPSSATTVNCATFGWPSNCSVTDIHGNAVPLPATLPAGTASVYLRSDSSWLIK